MDFAAISGFFESHARAISVAYDRRFGLMHPGIRMPSARTSGLRAKYGPEEVICSLIEKQESKRVLDLGCGFCASMLYLSNIRPETQFSGICASETEILASRNIIREADKIKSVLVFKGDFEEVNNFRVFPRQDMAYAIDSFRYVRNIANYFHNIFNILESGSSLFIIDCFALSTLRSGKKSSVSLFQRLAKTIGLDRVWDIAECHTSALKAGFTIQRQDDWSAWARRPFLRKLFNFARRFSIGIFNKELRNALRGWDILESGISKGIMSYQVLEFKKP